MAAGAVLALITAVSGLSAQPLEQRAIFIKLRQPPAGGATEFALTDLGRQLGATVKTYDRFPGYATVIVPEGDTTQGVLERLRANPAVENAAPHLTCRLAYTPNDPYFRDTDNPDYFDPEDPEASVNQYYLYDVEAPGAWDYQRSASYVKVAIIDSGVSLFHEDLYSNVWTNAGEVPNDGVDNDNNGFIDDYYGWDFVGADKGDPTTDDPTNEDNYPGVWDPSWPQPETEENIENLDSAIGDTLDNNSDGGADLGVTHGTMVAGLASAVADNSMDLAGMGFNAKIMTVRVVNAEGWGWGVDAADAITYAADQEADVINLSFSFGRWEDIPPEELPEAILVRDAITYAHDKGCLIVASAGNSRGSQGYSGGIDFPASMNETISVGAVDWEGHYSDYSNWALPGETLDIVAPGDLTWTTSVLDASTWAVYQLLGYDIPLGTDLIDIPLGGTSFSAPIVSGYAALLRASYPELTLDQFREILHATATDLGPEGYDADYGYGLLNARGGIEYIPEPSTFCLMLVGLGAPLLGRWRKRLRRG